MNLKSLLNPVTEIIDGIDPLFASRLDNFLQRIGKKELETKEVLTAIDSFDKALKEKNERPNKQLYVEHERMGMLDHEHQTHPDYEEDRLFFDDLEIRKEHKNNDDEERGATKSEILCDGKKIVSLWYWACLLEDRIGYSRLKEELIAEIESEKLPKLTEQSVKESTKKILNDTV